MNNNNNIAITRTFPRQRVEDLLCCAFEDGSAYWAESEGGFEQAFEPGGVIIREFEEDEPEALRLDREALTRGMQILADKYPRHFARFVAEDEDAETGDVFLQCCVFGEIVYG